MSQEEEALLPYGCSQVDHYSFPPTPLPLLGKEIETSESTELNYCTLKLSAPSRLAPNIGTGVRTPHHERAIQEIAQHRGVPILEVEV